MGLRSSAEKMGLEAGSEKSGWRCPISLNPGFPLLRMPSPSSFTCLMLTRTQPRCHLDREALPPAPKSWSNPERVWGLAEGERPEHQQHPHSPSPTSIVRFPQPTPGESLTPQPQTPDAALRGSGEKGSVNSDHGTVCVAGGLKPQVRIPLHY